jgi:CO/xanthine dehydrogenase Mo-binding subunit
MTAEIESSQARTHKLQGLGTRRKRVEDVRFTQGKGNYVDDLKFPGMRARRLSLATSWRCRGRCSGRA